MIDVILQQNWPTYRQRKATMLWFGNYANFIRTATRCLRNSTWLTLNFSVSLIAALTFHSMPTKCGYSCSASATFRDGNYSSTPVPSRRQWQRRLQLRRQTSPRMENQWRMVVADTAREYHQRQLQRVTANQIHCHREWEWARKSIR